jgi:hypothetical protein
MTDLKFDEQGLLPAVVQDWLDGTVLSFLEPLETETMGKGGNVGPQTAGQGPVHRL